MINDGLFDNEFNQPLPKVETKLPQNYTKDLQALPEKNKNNNFFKNLFTFNDLMVMSKAVGHNK